MSKKYTSLIYLSHNESIVRPGEVVELTDEQAERLAGKVEPLNVENKGNNEQTDKDNETHYQDMKVAQLKEIAKNKGIENSSDMKKQELVDALKQK